MGSGFFLVLPAQTRIPTPPGKEGGLVGLDKKTIPAQRRNPLSNRRGVFHRHTQEQDEIWLISLIG
jgi:hypothetical protein